MEVLIERFPPLQRGCLGFELVEIALSPLIFHSCCRYCWHSALIHGKVISCHPSHYDTSCRRVHSQVHMNAVLKLENSLIMLPSLGGINPKADEVQSGVPPMLLAVFGGRRHHLHHLWLIGGAGELQTHCQTR